MKDYFLLLNENERPEGAESPRRNSTVGIDYGTSTHEAEIHPLTAHWQSLEMNERARFLVSAIEATGATATAKTVASLHRLVLFANPGLALREMMGKNLAYQPAMIAIMEAMKAAVPEPKTSARKVTIRESAGSVIDKLEKLAGQPLKDGGRATFKGLPADVHDAQDGDVWLDAVDLDASTALLKLLRSDGIKASFNKQKKMILVTNEATATGESSPSFVRSAMAEADRSGEVLPTIREVLKKSGLRLVSKVSTHDGGDRGVSIKILVDGGVLDKAQTEKRVDAFTSLLVDQGSGYSDEEKYVGKQVDGTHQFILSLVFSSAQEESTGRMTEASGRVSTMIAHVNKAAEGAGLRVFDVAKSVVEKAFVAKRGASFEVLVEVPTRDEDLAVEKIEKMARILGKLTGHDVEVEDYNGPTEDGGRFWRPMFLVNNSKEESTAPIPGTFKLTEADLKQMKAHKRVRSAA